MNATTDHEPCRRGLRGFRALRCDRRGAAAVEYLVLVGSVALLSIPAAVALGQGLVDSFSVTREMLFSPVP